MRELYKRLYNDCLQSDTFKEDAHFVSMQGVFYEENEKSYCSLVERQMVGVL